MLNVARFRCVLALLATAALAAGSRGAQPAPTPTPGGGAAPAATPAYKGMRMGDKPALNLAATDGSTVNMEALRGRLVLIDLWVAMDVSKIHAPRLVAAHQKWAPRGLAMVGVGVPVNRETADQMNKYVKENAITWPQHLDTTGAVAKMFMGDSLSLPHAYLFGPDGSLLWHGHTNAIDQPIEDAFVNHPPQLVDAKTLAAATAACDAIDAALKANDKRRAMQVLGSIPAQAKFDGKIALRIDAFQKQLEDVAAKLLTEAEEMVGRKDYASATIKFREVAGNLGALPAGAKAKQRLTELGRLPEAKAQIDAAERAERATEAMGVAGRLKDGGKHELAYERFKAIARDYAATPVADLAQAEVKKYEADAQFMKQFAENSVGAKAKSMLSMAQSYAAAGRTDLARRKFQDVVEQFPNTPFAATARTELAKLPK